MPAETNPLAKYATYNYLWTFYCVSPSLITNANYRKVPPTNVVLSSAGRYGDQRVQTIYNTSPEYYIDNVEFECIIVGTPGSGNASQLIVSFEVLEPYSLGIFLQSCQVAALDAGYRSYDQAYFILKLEFRGQTTEQAGASRFGGEELGPYYFLVKLTQVEFSVNEAGSKYRVKALPQNHIKYLNTNDTVYNDLKLRGATAREVLSDSPEFSLAAWLNRREENLVKNGVKKLADKYEIVFPPCDWGDPNPFDPGSFEFDPGSKGGTEVFKRYADVVDENGKSKREMIVIDPKTKSFQFSQSTSIINAIDQIVLTTKAAQTAFPKRNSAGWLVWWKVEMESNPIAFDKDSNEFSFMYTYKVVPFWMHETVYLSPNASARGMEPGGPIYQELPRVYDYIFTGKNTEILKFDIEIKLLFYKGRNPNPNESTKGNQGAGTQSSLPSSVSTTDQATGNAIGPTGADQPPVRPDPNRLTPPRAGGSGVAGTSQQLAYNIYQAALQTTTDMIQLKLEIMGDPYWLPEHGNGNYSPVGGGLPYAGENKTMNYTTREIFIGVYFKTVIDAARGNMPVYEFQDGNSNSPYSGIYKVIKVTHNFSGGFYKCILECIRSPNQNLIGDGEPEPYKITTESPIGNTVYAEWV